MKSSRIRLAPGHPALDLPPAPFRDLKRVLRFDGETPVEVGTCSEVLAFDERAARPTMRRKQVVRFAPIGEIVGVSTFDPASLAPISHQTRRVGLRVDANYSDAEVTGATEGKSIGRRPFRIPLHRAALDLYGIELTLRSIALGAGLEIELEVFWPERAQCVAARLIVIGNEPTRAGPAGLEPAWIVRLTLDEVVSDYRVGAESRELLAQSQRLSDGTRVDFVR